MPGVCHEFLFRSNAGRRRPLQFILYLGHPTYALSIVLCALLLSSAAGSALGHRLAAARQARALAVPLAGMVLVLAFAWLAPLALRATAGLPFPGRVAVSLLVVAPLGAVLGLPFPLGIRRVAGRSSLVGWAWAVNGAASVAAPAIATLVAIVSGFRAALLAGAVAYGVAALTIRSLGEATDGPPARGAT